MERFAFEPKAEVGAVFVAPSPSAEELVGGDEHERRHAIGMLNRVREAETAAPGMSDEGPALNAAGFAQTVEIRDRGGHVIVRFVFTAAATALVEPQALREVINHFCDRREVIACAGSAVK